MTATNEAVRAASELPEPAGEVTAECPWRPNCWSRRVTDEADAADDLDRHLDQHHGGQSPPDDEADRDWEAMQDEGRWPAWM